VEVRDFAIRRFGSGAYVLLRGINEPLPFFAKAGMVLRVRLRETKPASTVNAGQGG